MSAPPTLSIVLIARNEEAHLRRCLESVRGLADEIVLADTGSTDGTVAIARECGARVLHVEWQDDFSAARNVTLEAATGDWILSIDADESIAARDHARIRAMLRRDDVDAAVVPQRHYLTTTVIGWQPGSGGYDEGTPYPGYLDVECRRLFRNAPRLRFRNRVHEELVSTDPSRPLRQAAGDWVIHHFGKVGADDVLRAKGEAYLRIGRRKVEDDPCDPQAHYELGVQYGELGQPEEALRCFAMVQSLSRGYRDTQLRLALTYGRLRRYRDALDALKVAARTLPREAAVIALEEGNIHRAMKDEPAAERAWRRAVTANPALAPASVNLARLCLRGGRAAEALTILDTALTHSPAHPPLLRVKTRVLLQQRQYEAAAACVGALSGPPDAEVAGLCGAIALGTGAVQNAVAHLRRSLDLQPTPEAALNLSTALEAAGDPPGALRAAAEALRLSPAEPRAAGRVAQLAGDTLAKRAQPADPETFAIYFVQPHSVPFDGRTPRTRGLGGTESAIVYLAEALARLGRRVVVFNNCEAPATVEGVEYARWETLPARCISDRPDVIVAVRHWEMLGRLRLAPLQIFWTGDAFDQPYLERIGEEQARQEIDFFMLQSDWQAETFAAQHGIPPWRILRTRLGAAASARTDVAPPPPIRGRRLAYASTPFRGLDVLLDLFPRIRAACPDAELDLFSSMRVYGMSEAEDRRQYGALYAKAEQPGVSLVGSLPQFELAERLRTVRILAYPNHYAETFCIAAIEAQSAGAVVVTSALGALPETVGEGGVCIPGRPQDAAYQDAFVNACVALLQDEDRWRAMSAAAIDRTAAHYTWPVIAAEWDELCRAALTDEPPLLARLATHLGHGRAALAQRMLEREPAPSGVPSRGWSALRAFVAAQAAGAAAPSDELVRELALHFRSFRAATPPPRAA